MRRTLYTTTTMMTPKPSSNTNTCTQHHHTPSATLDILILILVLFSGTFLLTSYFSYIFHTVSLLLPENFSISRDIFSFSFLHFLPVLGLVLGFGVEIFCGKSKRKCGKRGCKGMKKALEFDLQLQSEEMLRGGGNVVREVEELPWKGGSEGNRDYECLRSELRKMAPVNGRAVLLFRLKCGCAVAKLEGWGPKRGRRNRRV